MFSGRGVAARCDTKDYGEHLNDGCLDDDVHKECISRCRSIGKYDVSVSFFYFFFFWPLARLSVQYGVRHRVGRMGERD